VPDCASVVLSPQAEPSSPQAKFVDPFLTVALIAEAWSIFVGRSSQGVLISERHRDVQHRANSAERPKFVA